MSYQPKVELYASPFTLNRIDDIQLYTDLTEINALSEKFIDVIYRDNSTGNQYTWDGAVLNFYNNITSGSVSSVSKTGNTVVVNNTDPHNPIISTSQELDTTATPSFTRVSSTQPPTAPNHCITKTYLESNSVQTITSLDTNVLTVGGTVNNITLDSKLGFGDAGLYTMANSANSSGNITTSNNANFATATTLSLNYQALNRLDSNYVKYLLTSKQHAMFKIDLVNNVDGTQYASFLFTSINTIGANSITYNVKYVAGSSTVSTFSNGTTLKIFFPCYDRTNTSNQTFLLEYDNTIKDAPVFKPKMGAKNPLLYTFRSPATDGSHLSMNSAPSTTTQIGIGWQPVNRSNHLSDYIQHHLQYINKYLPAYLRLIDTTNNANYATYTINSLAGTGAFSYSYNVSYVGAESSGTLPQVSNTSQYHTIIEISPSSVSFPISATNVANDNTGRGFILGTTLDEALDNADAQIVASTFYINRNLGAETNVQTYSFSSQINPTSVSIFGYGSLDIVMGGVDAFSTLINFQGRMNHRLINHYTGQKLFFGVQLTGASWNTVDFLSRINIGFIQRRALNNIEEWGTSDFILGHDLTWNASVSSGNRAIWGRFSNATDFQATQSGGGFVNSTRTGTTGATPTVNDVLICYVNPTTYEFTIEWRDSTASYALKSTGTRLLNGGAEMRDNFMADNVHPIVGIYNRGANYSFRFLSERDIYSLQPSMIPSNGLGYLY